MKKNRRLAVEMEHLYDTSSHPKRSIFLRDFFT